MKYFLGFDVGSSKTHALIADETGHCLGFGQAGSGNHQNVGYAGLEHVLRESFAQAGAMAGVAANQIAGAGLGVAGYDFASDREAHLQAVASLELACPVEVVNDGFNGLLAGATRGIGINVTAGSSNNCRGRNKHGKIGRIVGNGMQFGEFGGATEIVQRGLQMVNYAWIQRIPPTRLTQIYLAAAGAKSEIDLMQGLSNERYDLPQGIAIEVVRAAQESDAAAQEIIHWAGEELGWLAISVARQIEMENDAVEIIQSGSVFEAGDIIKHPMREIVMKHLPKATLIPLDGPPAVGAVILGMEQANFDGYAVRDMMVHTAKKIMA
jgi:N-acetylglucosamine kinase-like BadF-type ATPase